MDKPPIPLPCLLAMLLGCVSTVERERTEVFKEKTSEPVSPISNSSDKSECGGIVHVSVGMGRSIASVEFKTDPVFKPFIEDFKRQSIKQIRRIPAGVDDIPIVFGETSGENAVGTCYRYANGRKLITIKEDDWHGRSHTTQKALIFHELGHCNLNRDHDEGMMTPRVPESLICQLKVEPPPLLLP